MVKVIGVNGTIRLAKAILEMAFEDLTTVDRLRSEADYFFASKLYRLYADIYGYEYGIIDRAYIAMRLCPEPQPAHEIRKEIRRSYNSSGKRKQGVI